MQCGLTPSNCWGSHGYEVGLKDGIEVSDEYLDNPAEWRRCACTRCGGSGRRCLVMVHIIRDMCGECRHEHRPRNREPGNEPDNKAKKQDKKEATDKKTDKQPDKKEALMHVEALMHMLDTDRVRQILGRGRQLLFATGLCDDAGRLLPSIAEGVARGLAEEEKVRLLIEEAYNKQEAEEKAGKNSEVMAEAVDGCGTEGS